MEDEKKITGTLCNDGQSDVSRIADYKSYNTSCFGSRNEYAAIGNESSERGNTNGDVQNIR